MASSPFVWQLGSGLLVAEHSRPDVASEGLSLPLGCADSALALSAHAPWSPPHLAALGVTHLLRLATSAASEPPAAHPTTVCAQCSGACGCAAAEAAEAALLDVAALDRAVAFVEQAVSSGGRALVLSATSGAAAAVAVAVGMQRGASLFDAFLEARAARAGLELSSSDTKLLQKWANGKRKVSSRALGSFCAERKRSNAE